jgi:MFS family permease
VFPLLALRNRQTGPTNAVSEAEVPQPISTPADEPPSEMAMADLARPSTAFALFSVFRHRNYRLFFAGQLVSLMGTWMQSVAQAWLVYRLTHSPLMLGLTSFCAQVTVFFMAAFGGMIADRVDRRKMLLITQAFSMLQAGILAVLTLSGMVQVWEIIALAFGIGLINSVDVPTRQAMTIDMVGREDLRHAIALNSMMFNLARVIGPSIAGALIAIVGEGPCFALNTLSFAAVLTSLFLMELPERRHRRGTGTPLQDIALGYRYSFRTPSIRTALMLVGISSMFGAAYLTLLPAFARDILRGASASYGLLMTAVGIGALIGAYALSLIRERWLTLAPIAAAASFGLCLILFSHSHVLWLSLLLLLPTACSLMLLGGTANTIIQTVANERYRGRAISHYTQAFLGMMPWGSLLLGFLASRIGIGESVTLGGAVVMFSAALAWRTRARRDAVPVASG